MTSVDTTRSVPDAAEEHRQSLSTAAARNLASTTKTKPQMQEITSRWILKTLPWVQMVGGAYRVNRRLTYTIGDGRLTFTNIGADVQVVPGELRELPILRGFEDTEILAELARRFEQRQFEPGQIIVEAGQPADQVVLIAHGKVEKIGAGQYDDDTVVGVLADGEYFGDQVLGGALELWNYTMRAKTNTTVLVLPRAAFEQLNGRAEALREHIARMLAASRRPQNKHGEAAIDMSSGHIGEPSLPATFVDYEPHPREYELSVAQTILRVHSRVADLYNEPHDQIQEQLRLTVEALRERQEFEMVNNRDFGLLHQVDLKERIHTRSGPPTPDDMDELLSRRRKTQFFYAHPQAIAAFGRECTKRGIYPDTVDLNGHRVPAWRGVPMLPCSKIPVSDYRSTSIIAVRLGEEDQGVIGLHKTGIPDEYEPGLNVRFMGIDDKAIISYLVSAYYSVAVLVPDALGVLDDVQVGFGRD